MDNVSLIENAGICLMMMLFHFSTKWLNQRNEDLAHKRVPAGLLYFIGSNPAYILTTVLGTISAFWAFYSMEWLNPGSALALGWAGSSMAKNTAEKFAKEHK